MRATWLLLPLAIVPGLPLSGCPGKNSGTSGPDAPIASGSAPEAPHDYGTLTDDEIKDAIARKAIVAIVRVAAARPLDVGTKSASIQYDLDLVRPLTGSPPSQAQRLETGASLGVGRPYAVIIERVLAAKQIVRAVEIEESKLREAADAYRTRADALVAAALSASPSSSQSVAPSASVSVSATPSSKPSGKPSAAPSGKPSAKPK